MSGIPTDNNKEEIKRISPLWMISFLCLTPVALFTFRLAFPHSLSPGWIPFCAVVLIPSGFMLNKITQWTPLTKLAARLVIFCYFVAIAFVLWLLIVLATGGFPHPS